MDQSVVEHPVTLIIKAPNQKYTDQTISCFLEWTVGKLKSHLSKVYPSKPVSYWPALFPRLVGKAGHCGYLGTGGQDFPLNLVK